jgi:hypothetical protein
MTRYKFYVGTLGKDGKGVDHAKCREILCIDFGAFTAFAGTGEWEGTEEDSVCYEVLDETSSLANNARARGELIASALRDAANQTCVLYTVEEGIYGGFV